MKNNKKAVWTVVVVMVVAICLGAFIAHVHKATSGDIKVELPSGEIRSGTKFTLPNGETVFILDRCQKAPLP